MIKSEKAKKYLDSKSPVKKVGKSEHYSLMSRIDAEKAIILAESDADEFHRAELIKSQDNMMKIYDKKIIDIKQSCRERAVRAFQASCDNYDNGNCELWYGVESERKCPGEMGCASIDNFLKNYDNDSKD